MDENLIKALLCTLIIRGFCYAVSFKVSTEVLVMRTINKKSDQWVDVTQLVMPYTLFFKVWLRAIILPIFPKLRVEGTNYWLNPGVFGYVHQEGEVAAKSVQLVVRVIDDFGISPEFNDSFVVLTETGIKVYPIQRKSK